MNISSRAWTTIRGLALLGALVAALAVLGVTAAYALGWKPGGDKAPPVTVRGSLKLSGGAFSAVGTQCLSTGGYDDIAAGAPVVVHDAAGKVIAMGALRAGRSADFFDNDGEQIAATCEFQFEVANVPSSKFYGVQVSHRGTVAFSDAQVTLGQVTLTLGS